MRPGGASHFGTLPRRHEEAVGVTAPKGPGGAAGYPADRGGSPLISGAREVGAGAKNMPLHCRATVKGRPLPKSVRWRYRPKGAAQRFMS